MADDDLWTARGNTRGPAGPAGPEGPVSTTPGPAGPAGPGVPATGLPVIAVNRVTNPTAAVNVAGYAQGGQGNSDLTRDTVMAPDGCVKATARNAAAFAIVYAPGGPLLVGPGERWNVTFKAYVSGAGVGTSGRVQVFGGGVAVTIAVTEYDKWVTYAIPVTTTAAGNLGVGVLATADQAGRTLYMDDLSVTKGDLAFAYFDGDQPGARWTGAAHASTSELVTARAADLQTTARSAVRYLEGAGSPAGLVDAPIGWRWIDTDKTNGAIEWISTQSGTGGWAVRYGDTGVRDVKALVGAGFTASVMRLLRVDDTCTLWYANVGHAAGFNSGNGWQTLLTLSLGFRARSGMEFESQATVPVIRQRVSGSLVMLLGTVGAGAVNLTGSYTWQTTDPWPVGNLPGAVA